MIQRIRLLEAAAVPPEKMGLDGETGFVLHRTVMLAAMGSMLTIFGPYALHVLVILAQAVGAGSEIMRDQFVGMLMASRRPASAGVVSATGAVGATGRAGAKHRRRRR